MSNAAGGSRFPALTTRYDFKTADNKGLLQLHGLAHENRVAPKNSSSEEKFGWGVGIGGKYDITPQVVSLPTIIMLKVMAAIYLIATLHMHTIQLLKIST